MCGVDKNRFIPEESGRLVTAFLERFFERYVSLRLHRRARGRARRRLRRPARLAEIARGLLARLQAQGGRGDGAEAVGGHRGARRFPRALAVSPTRGRQRPARCARRAATGGWRCAAASSARSSPAPIIPSANTPRSSARAARRPASEGPAELGNGIELKSGRFGPYLERDGKRASIPKDVPARTG